MTADRRACVKRKHKTLEEAMIALKRQPMKCLQPYQCKKCGSWHLAQQKRGGHYFQKFIDRVMRPPHDR